MCRRNQQGFSLVELAIVILIMGLVLGGIAMPLAAQRENARIRDGRSQLEDVRVAVEGFAVANGFLPCPATPASNGLASTNAGGCEVQHGFVPATTLDLGGIRNADNLLLDPWISPLRYSITASDADLDGNWDFAAPGEMRDVTMPVLQPDLAVCSSATGASPDACGSANVTLSVQTPLVIYSMGKDWNTFSSPDQLENAGDNLGGGASGDSYDIAGNDVFVSRGSSKLSGSEFDDLLIWVSANSLYRVMVEAGRLP